MDSSGNRKSSGFDLDTEKGNELGRRYLVISRNERTLCGSSVSLAGRHLLRIMRVCTEPGKPKKGSMGAISAAQQAGAWLLHAPLSITTSSAGEPPEPLWLAPPVHKAQLLRAAWRWSGYCHLRRRVCVLDWARGRTAGARGPR